MAPCPPGCSGRPLRDTLVKAPKLGNLTFPTTQEAANTRMAEILRDRCLTDVAVSGATDCPDIFAGYAKLCDQPETLPKDQAASVVAQVKGKADAGVAKEARAEAGREHFGLAPRITPNTTYDGAGCEVCKEGSGK